MGRGNVEEKENRHPQRTRLSGNFICVLSFLLHLILASWQIQQKDEFVKLVRAAKENKQSIPSSRSIGPDT